MRSPRVTSVVINAVDHDLLVTFWSSLLGVAIARSVPPYFTWLEPQPDAGVAVAIQAVAEPTAGRNRLHLDTQVDDLDDAVAHIESLGGSHIEDHEVSGFRWKVMADPEGNEFCIAETH